MKIRMGFVSNSSSSSFILATNKSLDELTITLTVKLGSIIERELKSKAEVDQYIQEEWGGQQRTIEEVLAAEGEWLNEKYVEMLRLVEDGKTVLVGQVSNDAENFLSTMLHADGFKKFDGDFEVISDARRRC